MNFIHFMNKYSLLIYYEQNMNFIQTNIVYIHAMYDFHTKGNNINRKGVLRAFKGVLRRFCRKTV